MSTTVVGQYRAQVSNNGGPTVSDTPVAGDVLFLAILGNRATPRTISSVSGCGATWTEVYNNGDSRLTLYKGTGTLTTGAITVTLSGTQTSNMTAWLVRDLSASTVVGAVTGSASATSQAGPSQNAGFGQAVLTAAIVTVNPISYPVSQTPASGWTNATNGTITGASYRTPSATEAHQNTATQSSASAVYVGQFVIGDEASVTMSLAGSLIPLTASFTLDAGPFMTLAGNLPALTGAFDLNADVPPEMSLAGSLLPLTGSFDLTVSSSTSATLAGSLPSLTGSFAIGVTPQTNIHNRTSGRHRRSYATATWEPPVDTSLTVSDDYETAIAFSTPTFDNGRPLYTVTKARAKRHRDRIVVGGKDITFFRGVHTPTPEFRLIQPLSYGSGSLELPQVYPVFETLGVGDLSWLKPDAVVKVQRVDVDTNTVVAEDYRGVITRFEVRGTTLVCILGGEIAGRAADQIKPVPVARRRREGGSLLAQLLRPLALRPVKPRFGPVTGITLNNFGGLGMLEAVSQTITQLTTRSGVMRTVVLDEAANVWRIQNKDLTTVHATIYFDEARMVPDLVRDTSEEPNRVFATGVDDDGRKIKFAIYPGIRFGDPPDYPMLGGASFGEGTTDADTDTGDGVSVMIHRLISMGFTGARDSSDFVFDAKVTAAIKDLQERDGLAETGVINLATWDALFDLNATGYDLRGARIIPAAQRSYTMPWFMTSSGAISRRNPNYDPHRRKVDVQVDFGATLEDKQQGRDWARGLLSFGESNWVGTVTCNLALIRGEHNPGDPLTAADVMSAREIRPGMNVWAPLFDGGTLFHVVGVGVPSGGRAPQLALDTRARDTMPAWECIQRNRASRHSPARAWLDQYRSSITEKDGLITWDSIGGTIDMRVRCNGGRWTVFPVVAGQAGTVQKIAIETFNNQAEFAMAVFGKSIRPERLDNLIANPLTEAGTEKWSDDDVLSKLQDRVFLYSSGTHDQPLGYFPKAKTGEDGEPTGAPITGRHEDDASFGFHTFAEPVLYVAIWADRDCWIRAGRIMWNQLEEGS